jgi:hypothetical protein
MEWINEPPCTELLVDRQDAADGLLVLTGPRTGARLKGGLVAAMGAAFAATAASFLRLPFPPAWKVIPAVMVATGGGMAALGVASAISDVRIEVRRGKGIRWAWTPRPMAERELLLKPEDIAAFEIKTNVVRRSAGEFSFQDVSHTTFHLMVVTRDGKAYSIEEFSLSTQAQIRRDQIEQALGRKVVEARRAPARAPRKKAASGKKKAAPVVQ